MFFALFQALFLGGAVGAFAEYFRFTRNGYVISIIIAIGGAIAFWFVMTMLGLNLGLGRAGVALVGAAGALFLASMRR